MMQFDVGIICSSQKLTLLARHILVLSRSYDLRLCAFDIHDLDPDNGGHISRAVYWDGNDFATTTTTLPKICESLFYYRSPQLVRGRSNMNYIVRHARLSEYEGFSKTRLSQLLNSSPSLIQYGIPTYPVTQYRDFLLYASLLKLSIVKPSAGRQGKLVRYIERIDGDYWFTYGNHSERIDEAVWNSYVTQMHESHLGHPILQPRLDFHYDDDHAVDFRVLSQRGASGDWEKVLFVARIGVSKTVSNVAQGGFLSDVMSALQYIAPEDAANLYAQLEDICTRLPREIQKCLPRPISCLGIDVGLDRKTKQLFVMETNSYPGTKQTWLLANAKIKYLKFLAENPSEAAIPEVHHDI